MHMKNGLSCLRHEKVKRNKNGKSKLMKMVHSGWIDNRIKIFLSLTLVHINNRYNFVNCDALQLENNLFSHYVKCVTNYKVAFSHPPTCSAALTFLPHCWYFRDLCTTDNSSDLWLQLWNISGWSMLNRCCCFWTSFRCFRLCVCETVRPRERSF